MVQDTYTDISVSTKYDSEDIANLHEAPFSQRVWS